MSSFEELGISPLLVEALASEGIEVPTALQSLAIPVLARGHSAVLRGGPGSGILVAWGAPILQRLEAEAGGPRALVLTPSRGAVLETARALARLSTGSGHRIGALGIPWVLPELSDLLVTTPEDLRTAIQRSQVGIEELQVLVLDHPEELLTALEPALLQSLLGSSQSPRQLALVAEPLTPAVRGFIDQHMSRAVFLPPDAASEVEVATEIRRGTLQLRRAGESRELDLLPLVADQLEEGHPHLLLFVRSDDRIVEVGDELALHGFIGGAPGDSDCPLWLAVDALETRALLREFVQAPIPTISVDPPADADELDRRHSGGSPGFLLARPRELPHLRRIAQIAGYQIEVAPEPSPGPEDRAASFLDELRRTLVSEDLVPHLALLEPLVAERSGAEVAAALALLLRRERAAAQQSSRTALPGEAKPPAWVRLFISLGSRDGIRAGDLVGAIVGEAGVRADQVGRIDLRESFSRVEVDESIGEKVARALNGTTIRGRSIRADFDRGIGGATRGEAPARKGKPPSRSGDRGGGGGGGRKPAPGGRKPPGDRPPRSS